MSVLGEMDAWIICPFFLQGGRFTINDIHYVAEDKRYCSIVSYTVTFLIFQHSLLLLCSWVCRLVPAGDTEFAKDAAFGYKCSNLREVRNFPLYMECIVVLHHS